MRVAWADAPFLGIDCESTSVDPWTARIVELAIAEVAPDGQVLSSSRWVVNPDVDIPTEAAAIHGITTERARAEGVPVAEALAGLSARLYDNGLKAPVAGFNMRYDLPLILSEADRHGVDVPMFAPVLDAMVVDRGCDRYRKGSRKLTAVADHYDVALGADAHGALADAVAAARVMHALVARFPELAEQSLSSLWLKQSRWFETWREGFEDYLRRTKDPQAVLVPGWPLPCSAAVS